MRGAPCVTLTALSASSRRDTSSRAYGITQYNRAQAHYRLAQTSPGGNPKVAVTCLEEAFAAFQSCGEDRYTQLVRAQLERICRQ